MSRSYSVAVVMLTYDRVADAKMSMKLIKESWPLARELRDVDIFHVFDGKREWYQETYLEKVCVRCENLGHFYGLVSMANKGIELVIKSPKLYDFIFVMSADVWLWKPEILVSMLDEMVARKYFLASSRWFDPMALGTEFMIIVPEFAKKVFPLELSKYLEEHKVIKLFSKIIAKYPVVERCFADKVAKILVEEGLSVRDKVLWFPHRSYVFYHNQQVDDSLGYLSLHNLERKRALLKKRMMG